MEMQGETSVVLSAGKMGRQGLATIERRESTLLSGSRATLERSKTTIRCEPARHEPQKTRYLLALRALSHRNICRRVHRPDILCPRANQTVIVKLLDDMCSPTRNAAHSKNRRVEIDVDAERGVGGGGVEVHVGVQLLFLVDVEFDGARHLVPARLACILAEFFRHASEVRGPGVLRLVDTMAKAGDLLPGGKHSLHVLDRIFSRFVNREQQTHYTFIRPSVQRALKRADGAGDGRVNIR